MRIVLALLNLLGFPGVGTLLAGHKRAGLAQLALGLSGFALTLMPFIYLAGKIHLPPSELLSDPSAVARSLLEQSQQALSAPALLPPLSLSLLGILLFFVNWLWSATTTGKVRPTPPPLP